MTGSMSWSTFLRPDFEFASSSPGALVVDIGCGEGEQLAALRARGCHAIGVDVDAGATAVCRAGGFDAVVARAEHIPLRAQVADGVICKVSLPYTDERAAIADRACEYALQFDRGRVFEDLFPAATFPPVEVVVPAASVETPAS